MTWGLKRQIFYVFIVIAFLGVFGYLIARPYLNKPPTCADGKQNGTELGVDCGGGCLRACYFQTDEISILWSRAFRVVPGRYNAVAYLENHNANTAVEKIKYRFRFADKDNLYIGKREGETTIPPAGKFAVFEPAIGIGNSIPVYTTFEFTEVPKWSQVSEEKVKQLRILVSDILLENPDTSPALSARIKNDSLFTIPEVNVIAILYDKSGNALSASRAYLGRLSGEEERNVSFTWPEPIGGEVIAKEVIPIWNIFQAKLER